MFDSNQKYAGTRCTTRVALLLIVFIFGPAVVEALGPVGYISLSLAIACSLLCVVFAWANWKKSSQLSIPSIAIPGRKTK
jgi:hypothetical protein